MPGMEHDSGQREEAEGVIFHIVLFFGFFFIHAEFALLLAGEEADSSRIDHLRGHALPPLVRRSRFQLLRCAHLSGFICGNGPAWRCRNRRFRPAISCHHIGSLGGHSWSPAPPCRFQSFHDIGPGRLRHLHLHRR